MSSNVLQCLEITKREVVVMKTLKQMIRQPLKSLIGLVFMTLAAAIACLCVCQAIAANSTKKGLDERFSTVAIPSLQEDLTGVDQIIVEDELLQWLQRTAQENPDVIRGIAPNGYTSAYAPQLRPFNYQTQDNVGKYPYDAALFPTGLNDYAGLTHYDSAMLVITLDSISQVTTPMDAYALREKLPLGYLDTTEKIYLYLQQQRYKDYRAGKDVWIYQQILDLLMENTLTYGYTVTLTGTIEQAVSLPDGVRDPLGMNARLTLTLSSPEEIAALGLEPGQQYIVYGMDYFDDYQFIVQYMEQSRFRHVSFEPFDPAKLTYPTADERRSFLENKRIDPVVLYDFVPLEQWQYDRFNTVSMTLCQPGNLIPYEEVRNELGLVVDCVPPREVTYTDQHGQTHTIPMAQYNARYAMPMIAPLRGSVEDFLASQAGADWQAALEQTQVNNHAFSVIGVDDMHQLPVFALGKTQIGEGREFTAEEVEQGAKVCIIHELVAQQSGLLIGDTITLNLYATDYGHPYQPMNVHELILLKTYEAGGKAYQPAGIGEKGLLRPAASLYLSTMPFAETVEYTIVGFWQGAAWPDMNQDYYQFSANTVFVPYASVQSSMEHPSGIPYVTVVLENGMIHQFHDLAKRSGYAGRFKYYDQGYAQIAVNFHNYEALAQQIMAVGIVIYVILLLLFLLLYPATQRKTVWTMQSLGCKFRKRFVHVLLHSMVIMVVASLLGGLAGYLLWDQLVAALQTTAESTIALQLESGVLVTVAAAQLLLGLVLSAVVAVVIALPRGISARR